MSKTDLRRNFKNITATDLIEVLSALIPKNKNSLVFNYATCESVAHIIRKAKPENSVGNDILNMKILKKLCPAILPHLTHLINSLIYTVIYLRILKVSRISPTLKADKPMEFIDSYRLIYL